VGGGTAGCGSRAQPTASPAAPLVLTPVGTATLEAAELGPRDRELEDAPHVGKSQRALPDDEADLEKGEGDPRRGDRRPGGGFSGYK
jgi:hypothetical protein